MIGGPTERELYGDVGDNDGGPDEYALFSLGIGTIALGARGATSGFGAGGATGIRSEYMPPKLDLPGTSLLGGGSSISIASRFHEDRGKYGLLGSLLCNSATCSLRGRPSGGFWLTGLKPRYCSIGGGFGSDGGIRMYCRLSARVSS